MKMYIQVNLTNGQRGDIVMFLYKWKKCWIFCFHTTFTLSELNVMKLIHNADYNLKKGSNPNKIGITFIIHELYPFINVKITVYLLTGLSVFRGHSLLLYSLDMIPAHTQCECKNIFQILFLKKLTKNKQCFDNYV